jgi:serine/threonine-protein kinase HipA
LHADHRVGSLDYRGALAAVHRLTGDVRAVEQMVRRMAFNVLAHNRDDHTKQHTLAMDRAGGWTLAPAYDLTFSAGPGGEHSMTVGGAGHPTRDDVLRVARESGLSARRAKALVEDVAGAVANWRRHAADAGVGRALLERIGSALGGP